MDKPEHEFRSLCSVARCLEVLGDKWTLLIIRDLLWHGKHTFQELQHCAEQVPTNLLSSRLKKLMQWEIVDREAYQDRPVRYRYFLTERGKKLESILVETMKWGHEYLEGGIFDPALKKAKEIEENQKHSEVE